MSTSNEDAAAPQLSFDTAIQKLRYYFNSPRKLRDSAHLALLDYTFRMLRDSGYNPGGAGSRRTPLLPSHSALEQAEIWVLGDLIRRDYEVDVLQHAAIQHPQDPAAALVPFLDHLVRAGRITQWTNDILNGKQGSASFVAARDRLEFARLSNTKPPGGATDAQRAHFTKLQQLLATYEKEDKGVFIYFGEELDKFSKSNEGLILRGEIYHPKDTDKAWKRASVISGTQHLKLTTAQQEAIAASFVDSENYPVEALKRLLSFVEFLALPRPQGLGLTTEAIDDKLAEYRRLPIRTMDGIARIRGGWKDVGEYGQAWLRGRGAAIFLDNLFDYASAEEFYRLLAIVDLNLRAERDSLYQRRFVLYQKLNPYDGTDYRDDPDLLRNHAEFEALKLTLPQVEARYEQWVVHYEDLSPFGWQRDAKPFLNEELPNCGRDTFDLVKLMPRPAWGYDQEYQSALKVICTDHVKAAQRDAIVEMKKVQKTQQKLTDAARLLQRVGNFMASLAEDMALQPLPAPEDGSLVDLHLALGLMRIHFTGQRLRQLSLRAQFFLAALRSAESELKGIGADAPLRELAGQLSQVAQELEALAQVSSGVLRHETWTKIREASFADLFRPDDQPPIPTAAAPGSDTAPSTPLVVEAKSDKILTYRYPHVVNAPVVPGFSSLVSDAMHRDQVHRRANQTFGNHYNELAKGQKDANKTLPGNWAQQNKEVPAATAGVVNRVTVVGKANSARASRHLQTVASPSGPATLPVSAASDPTGKLRTLGEYLASVTPNGADRESELRGAHVARLAAGIAYSNGDTAGGDAYATVGLILARRADGISDPQKLLMGLPPGVIDVRRTGSPNDALVIFVPNGRVSIVIPSSGQTRALLQGHPPKQLDISSAEANLRKAHEALKNTDTNLKMLTKSLNLVAKVTKNPDVKSLGQFTERLHKVSTELKTKTEEVLHLAEVQKDKEGAETASKALVEKLGVLSADDQIEYVEQYAKNVRDLPVGLLPQDVEEEFAVSPEMLSNEPKRAEGRFKSFLTAQRDNIAYLERKHEQLIQTNRIAHKAGKFWTELQPGIDRVRQISPPGFAMALLKHSFNADKLAMAYNELAADSLSKADVFKRAAVTEQRRYDNFRINLRTLFGFQF